MFSNMLILGNIEILEHWFQMNSLNHNSGSVFGQNLVDCITFFLVHSEILSSGKGSVVVGNWVHGGCWIFLDSVGGESRVDAMAESFVVNQIFWVLGLVFICHLLEFFFSKVEVEHRKDALKLRFGDLSSSEFIEIKEKFFNSDSFHYYLGSESILNIRWAVRSFDSLFQESVVDYINVSGILEIVSRSSVSESSI